MPETERYQRGLATRRKVLGVAAGAEQESYSDEVSQRLHQVATEVEWGDVWASPRLDPRLRSICAIAIHAARGQLDDLKLHTRGALRNGVTQDEIREVLFHVRVLAGAAVVREAVLAVREVLNEQEPAAEW